MPQWPPLLDRLPILGDRLADAPDAELRVLLEALQMKLAYHPAEQALDVAFALFEDGRGDDSAPLRAEDCSR